MPASTRILGKNALFKLAATDVAAVTDISGDGNEIVLNIDLNNEDSTGFGVNWREFEVIDGQFSIDFSAFYATGAGVIDEIIVGGSAMVDLFDRRLFEFNPNGTPASVTKPKYTGSVFVAGYPISASRAGITSVRARFQGTGTLTRAIA